MIDLCSKNVLFGAKLICSILCLLGDNLVSNIGKCITN